jgi:hypothetical protein
MAERIIGSLLEGDEEMVGAYEETKKPKGGKMEVAKKSVWDVVPCGHYC